MNVTYIQEFRVKQMAQKCNIDKTAEAIMAKEDEIELLEMSVITDFLDGQSDCKEGMPHKSGKGDAYDRGYAAQYELDQINNERTRNK
jgi:hypothetical protein|tara:strand:+ start:796 stop:1059 length:264 start_codon:yes stop_codon:yes gene_type:complete